MKSAEYDLRFETMVVDMPGAVLYGENVITDELLNVRVYMGLSWKRVSIRGVWSLRISKTLLYEHPYCVTGAVKAAGSQEAPK